MDAIVRATAIYMILLVIVRISGRRTLSQMTTFDFVLLLIIGEATQQGLLDEDFSLTNAFLVIVTLIGIDLGLSLLKQRFSGLAHLIEGVPMVIVDNGRPLRERMMKARISEDEVMEAARTLRGLERFDQIKFAVLEATGAITVIPREPPGDRLP